MISIKYRCLFVHVPKTGGTSLKRYLVGYDLTKCWQPSFFEAHLLYTHRSVAQLRRELNKLQIESANFFQFAFVRNPWDRLLSAFFYLSADGGGGVEALPFVAAIKYFRGDFQRFVCEGLFELTPKIPVLFPQHVWTHDDIDGQPLDFIGRFEKLAEDVAIVAQRLGLETSEPLPHLRACPHAHYTEYYNDETCKRVAEIYAQDIKLFDYRFGE